MNRQQGNRKMAGFEEQISHALMKQAGSLQVTFADEERMRCSVHRKIEEETGMRKWSPRKIMVMAAAVCVIGSMTAVAAGKVTQISSHSSHANDFTYDKLGEMEAKLGFTTKAPETFSSGFCFSTGVPVERSDMDEASNVVQKGEEVNLTYKKSGMPDIHLSVSNMENYGESGNTGQAFDHNGITVMYRADQYLFVPPDYQVSEEEQARADAGELFVSYGTDQVENQVIKGVTWTDGGISYSMITFDSSLTPEEMVQMAGEVIDNQ